jgi:hypothetical protein
MQTHSLSPSLVVYLRAEFFVPKKGDLTLPSGVQVAERELVMTILAAAFLGCSAQRVLQLRIHVAKRVFGLWTSHMLFADRLWAAVPWHRATLEARLARLAAQLALEERNRIQLMVHRLVSKHRSDPWRGVVKTVQDTLVDLGVLDPLEEGRRPRFAPDYVEAIIDLDPGPTKRLFDDCQRTTPELWWLLRKEIAHGLRYRLDTGRRARRADDRR